MHKRHLKVCGMRSAENIRETVDRCQPDYLGFIFYAKSPRYAPPAQLHAVLKQLGSLLKGTRRVGVFVNEEVKEIIRIGKLLDLNVIQLHGNESPQHLREVKQAGFEVWKVFSVADSLPLELMVSYRADADAFLLDTKTPAYGGSGKAFDWSLLSEYSLSVPFYLSGGIGPEHASSLAQLAHPYLRGVDLNSRFETEPGLKDAVLLQKFIEELRNTTLYEAK